MIFNYYNYTMTEYVPTLPLMVMIYPKITIGEHEN